jgi:hypothetical protein
MDNTATPVADNPVPSNEASAGAMGTVSVPENTQAQTGWKTSLRTDLRDSSLLSKFEDSQDGLNQAIESYGNLEKLLGHEKVPIPKGPEDAEGWNRFGKAMGIPDKSEGYGLADPNLPEQLKGSGVGKERFAEIVHAHKLTPAQAQGLWKVYNEVSVEQYNQALQAHEKNTQDMVSRLKGEWGDAFETNVELGQMVINKFSNDQDMNDYITAVLSQDPRGIKFLAKIGDQFAENKVGEFQMKRFSTSPEEAQNEIDKLVKDLDGPYMNQSGKFTDREHQAAIDRVNHLRASINRARG